MEVRRLVGLVLVVMVSLAVATPVAAENRALRFTGTGVDRVDRVEIRLDGPARPVDVGGAFTLEWWLRGTRAANPTGTLTCGTGRYGWITGHTVVDRDRWPTAGPDGRDFGVAVSRTGDLGFGVANGTGASRTVCTDLPGAGVLDGRWHHVAVQRGSVGRLQIWVDGVRRANAAGPNGDLSYPDGVAGARVTDPFLVLGAEKHDAGPAYPSFAGTLDELRISTGQRYTAAFTPRRRPFTTDARTVGLYHFDEATGRTVRDTSAAPGGPSPGLLRRTPTGAPHRVTTALFTSPP